MRIPTIIALVASVLALLVGPMVVLLFLGSIIGVMVGTTLILGGAVGLWLGMKSMGNHTGKPQRE